MINDAAPHRGIGDLTVGFAQIALGEIGQRIAARASAARHSADGRALVLQEALADRPALAALADEIAFGHAHVVQERLAERRCAADELDGLHRNAGRFHIEQHEGNAVVLGRIRFRAHQTEHPIGEVGAGCPDLGAVDDEIVAVFDGPRLQAGEVGTGTGLAIALAPPDFAAHDFRQVLLLLFFVAELQ